MIYSFCTNNRELPFRLNILSDYDSRIVPHLFGWVKERNALPITGIGMVVDFAIGWSVLYLMAVFMGLSFDDDILVGTASADLLFFISAFLLIAIFVPIVEELLFRGLVLDLLCEKYSTWVSILISSVIFGSSLQTGHFGSLLSFNFLNSVFSASYMSREPTKVSPWFNINFNVSTTCRLPMIPAKTPSTPPS